MCYSRYNCCVFGSILKYKNGGASVSVELPISIEHEIHGLDIYSLPYCILSQYKVFENWSLSHYLIGFSYINLAGNATFEYSDGITYNNLSFPHTPINIAKLSYASLAGLDISCFVKNLLNDGKYVIIFIDDYFNENSYCYMKRHVTHEMLYYGCEDDFFRCIGFDSENVFTKMRIRASSVVDGFKAGEQGDKRKVTWIDEAALTILTPIFPKNSILYNSEAVRQSLVNYFESRIASDYSTQYLDHEKKYYVGISNTKIFVETPPSKWNYPGLHAWYESKIVLYNRIARLLHDIDKYDDGILSVYKSSVIKTANIARMFFLKVGFSAAQYDRQDLFESIWKAECTFFEQLTNDYL